MAKPSEDLRILKTLRGSEAFKKLCEKCDEDKLGGLFMFLTHSSVLTVSGRQIHLRPMDSSISTTDPVRPSTLKKQSEGAAEATTRRFEKRQMERLQKKLAKLAAEIQALNRTPLARGVLDKSIEPTGFHTLPLALDDYAWSFIPLLLKDWENVGAQQHPDSNRLLRQICLYVRECHGSYRDGWVASILDDLNFHESQTNKPFTADALKQWRHRQGLTDGEDE